MPWPGPTSPITRQRGGSRVPAGNVATREWSSPPVSTHSWATSAGAGGGAGRDSEAVRSEIIWAAARAKFYSLTRAGRKQLEVETAEWTRRASAIARLLKAEG